MKIGAAGIALIKEFESLELKAYCCPAGVLTIGWGHTKGVTAGMTITEAEAEALLLEDLAVAERSVNRCIARNNLSLLQTQYDALVSFALNLGAAALSGSTLELRLKTADRSGAAEQFLRWKNIRVNGVLTPSNGLLRRRRREAALFLS